MDTITKALVPDSKREDFLYARLGKPFLNFEMGVFNVADKYTEYGGGFWDFYELSNGGFFMAPRVDQQWHFQNHENYADVNLSSEALGIVACLYVFSHMSFTFSALGDLYHQLREFALDHPEAAAIFEAID